MKTHRLRSIINHGTLLLLLAAPHPSQARNLFVTALIGNSSVNINVSEFATNGTLLQSFGNANLENPTGLIFDPQDNLYVVNFDKNTVEKITTNGVSLATLSGNNLDEPGQPAFDSHGNLFVVNYANSTISEFNASGMAVPFTAQGINYPSGLVIDANDNLFVANQGDNSLSEITPAGIEVSNIILGPNDLDHTPTSLAFDPQGVLYVGELGNTIAQIKDGVVTTVITNINDPADLVFDDAGNLFVTGAGSGTIVEYTNNEGTLSTNATIFASGLGTPTALAFQPAPRTSLGTLGVAISAGDTLVITLPPNSGGSILETATNLSSPVAWTPVITNGSATQVSVPLSTSPSSRQFFRLRE